MKPWKYLYDDYAAGTVFITRDPQESQTPLVAGLTIEQAALIVAALNAMSEPRHHPNFPGKQHVLPRPSQPAPKPIPPPPLVQRYFAPCDEHEEFCTGHIVAEVCR